MNISLIVLPSKKFLIIKKFFYKNREITKALLDSEPDIYQQINFSNNLNFSLISENLEYVWYCTSNPDFDLHHWLNNSETQNLLVNSLRY